MIVHSLHPMDKALAEAGMMGRRAIYGTLTDAEFREIEKRLRELITQLGADPGGILLAVLDSLVLSADARDLTHAQVEAAMSLIRKRLQRVRDGSLPRVPNFAVTPSGIHGRPIGPGLTLIKGGRTDPHPQPKGA